VKTTRRSIPLAVALTLALAAAVQTGGGADEREPDTDPVEARTGDARTGDSGSGDSTTGLLQTVPDPGTFGPDQSDLPAEWRERLLDTDLVRREQSFERLIQAARRNPSLGAVLRDWALDQRRPELAWTARMALRELARPPVFGFHGHLVPVPSPGGAGVPGSPGGPGSGPGAQALAPGAPPLAGGESSLSDTVDVRRGPAGVMLRVDAMVDGDRRSQVYEGSSLAEILGEHPELVQLLPRTGAEWVPGVPFGDRRPPWGVGSPVDTAVLGVVVRAPTDAERRRLGLGPGGLSVQRVVEDSIGGILDLRPGVVLLDINGHALDREEAISVALGARPDGGELRVTLIDAYGRQCVRTWRPAPE
jgi:hypothetical protein